MIVTREWAMPNHNTFLIKPIRLLLERYIREGDVVVDPFARNAQVGTHTNDLNPATKAKWHLPAGDFCEMLLEDEVLADVVVHDPPYSARQVKECYNGIGLAVHQSDTQTCRTHKIVKDGLDKLLRPGGVAISFGWNTVGFGKGRGYTQEEILLVCHGGGHNDTIVVVETKPGVVSLPDRRQLNFKWNASLNLAV